MSDINIDNITKEERRSLFKKLLKKDPEFGDMIYHHGDKRLLRDIIKQKTGYEVIPATQEQLEDAKEQALIAKEKYEESGIFQGRVNEFGNHMEKMFNSNLFEQLKPDTGYPDLQRKETEMNNGKPYFAEVKVTDKDSKESSFRSFYLSGALKKIKQSRAHILIAFRHKNKIISKEPIVIDLYDLELTCKEEWNCGNKTLYSIPP
jgi:hypothetical protein